MAIIVQYDLLLDANPGSESKLRSRIGTMLGRRRQSVHAGFGQLSPQKGLGSFSHRLGSSHSHTLSPRASSHNLAESHNRLSSVVERPTTEQPAAGDTTDKDQQRPHEGTNGVTTTGDLSRDHQPARPNLLNGTAEDIFDTPPPVPPLPQTIKEEPKKDAEGFTIPPLMNDPISQAQREAAAEAGETEQLFKLNIQNEPIAEEDQEAKQQAMSNVANALTSMAVPARRTGTVRGRREVRNTMYMPVAPIADITAENPFPPSPSLPASTSVPKVTPTTPLTSEPSHASDTQSIRSGTSVGASSSALARIRHPDLHGPNQAPGLHSSIIETVSAVFKDGEPQTVRVTGEIALAYVPDPEKPFTGEYTSRSHRLGLFTATLTFAGT